MAALPALRTRTFIVGGSITPFIGKGHPDWVHKKHPDFGKRENPGIEHYIKASVQGALKNTGVPAKAIQKAWIGNFLGSLFVQQAHLGSALVGSDPDLRFVPSMRVEGACASGGLAFASAVESIQAGTDIALVAGVEVQSNVSAREGGDYLARAAHYPRQRKLDDFTFPALFAQRMQAYCSKYSVKQEDVARVSVKAYANANANPLAHMRTAKMDLAMASAASDKNPAFLGNEQLKPWLRVSDCSQVSDGGAALVVVSAEGLKKLGKSPADCVEVLSSQVATDSLYTDGDLTQMETTATAAKRAYAQARLRPTDVEVAEVHDCFSIAEVLMYEALGFAAPGQGTQLLLRGETTRTGRLPVNTGGGLIGFGHPVGATGVKQLLELYRQMKGLCGSYQLPNRPRIGIAANMGGSDKTAVVTLVKNCDPSTKL